MGESSVSGQYTILYIEDDASSRLLVDRTLRFAGYKVFIAERGLEGIDLARAEHPDLILTDIDLPDISGRELTTMLRSDERFQKTPIVALTASGYGEQRDLAMAAGLTGYLTKPLDVETLPRQLDYYLSGGRDVIDEKRLSKAQTRYAQEVVNRLESRIRELEDKNQELIRLDQTKDTFIQLTAHELRTPLTLLVGYSGLMQHSPEISELMERQPEMNDLVMGLLDGIRRMEGIIDEIFTISRIMTNDIDPAISNVNLGQLMQVVLEKYRQVIVDRQLNIIFNQVSWPTNIRADGDLLQMVLSNLMSNAIKYTPNGGTVKIEATIDASYVYVRFVDNGIGIPPHELESIFETFYTANDPQFHTTSKTAFAGGGLGLGLAICKGIVHAHGGDIYAQSTGRDYKKFPGSEFVLRLPLITHTGDSNVAKRLTSTMPTYGHENK